MKQIHISEAEGDVLDWLVACAEYPDDADLRDPESGCMGDHEEYSTKWKHAGPIIEREKININAYRGQAKWAAQPHRCDGGCLFFSGPTPLVAAMRCYVAMSLGTVHQVPEELA